MSTTPEIVFTQYLVPPLQSGSATVTATQAITAPGGQGETFQATQSLFVRGARYTLDDAAVDTVFPPAGSQGEFANLLPHVVFTQPTLPWQRSPAAEPAIAGSVAAGDAGPPRATWLALLLFAETDPPPQPQAKTVADLTSTPTVFCAPRTLELGESSTDPVTVIDLPLEQFAARAPALADLDWTAHVRQTATAAKAAAAGDVPAGQYGVVFGTRLPGSGQVTTVHLVSLEGFGPYLPTEDGQASAQIPTETRTVRLVTLRSWTFSTIAFNQTFEGILTAVDDQPSGLQLPFATTAAVIDETVQTAFGQGYTALDHTLRDGSSTVSWYRGPLLPLGSERTGFAPSQAADQLLHYDPGSGMFDISYAAAWELGRLLGLHDRGYATALYRWKLARTQKEAETLEQELIDAALAPIGPDQPGEPPRPRDALARVAIGVLTPALAALAEGRPAPAERRSQRNTALPRIDREMVAARLRYPRRPPDDAPPSDPAVGTDEHQVISWLTQLHLLQGVPFNYLVPDIGMLPAESIRFFQVDYGWVEALIDGAFSLGTTRSAAAVAAALRAPVLAATRARLAAPRRRLLGLDEEQSAAPEALSGFLLRSAVVSGWPGMEVHGFADAVGATPLSLVRLERVAPALLLGLFGGILARVDFREPPEGLHFGVDFGQPPGTWSKGLRYADGPNAGAEIPGATVAVTVRTPATDNVIELDALAQAIAPKVWSQTPGTFTAAEFALEMAEGGEAVSFQVGS